MQSSKALDDEQISAFVRIVGRRAMAGDVVGKRNYALLLMFITTGMRRQEVIELRGSDLELWKDDLVVRCRVKGGDYVGRAINEPLVQEALFDYLKWLCPTIAFCPTIQRREAFSLAGRFNSSSIRTST